MLVVKKYLLSILFPNTNIKKLELKKEGEFIIIFFVVFMEKMIFNNGFSFFFMILPFFIIYGES